MMTNTDEQELRKWCIEKAAMNEMGANITTIPLAEKIFVYVTTGKTDGTTSVDFVPNKQ